MGKGAVGKAEGGVGDRQEDHFSFDNLLEGLHFLTKCMCLFYNNRITRLKIDSAGHVWLL